ncbi:putative paraquat-inducible protein A [Polaromonas sp. CG_9.5]|uniref:cysteine-rich CWC family protein n=1 Tax=Polaromonas sp. CG_9.5 TaxID=3071705 RepID=UPI002E016AD2|nr:putative paraquat-inducible protein A [Polaromonas sp. CG_9.5]
MASPDLKLANTSVCPRCGAGLRCGMVAGDAQCWCTQLPNVMPVPALNEHTLPDNGAASCFCPACLKQITDEQQHPLSTPRD